MEDVDVHSIPRHLSETAIPSIPGESDAQHYITLIFLEKESKKKKNLDGSLWHPTLHISLTYSSHLSSFYFFWTVSFIPAGNRQNISVGYAQQKPPLRKKKT